MKFLNYFFSQQQKEKVECQNKFQKISDAVANCELQILNKYTGLTVGESIFIRDINFQYRNTNTYIHTLECGRGNTEVMVLVHGYGGSAVTYYKLLNQLSEKYHVFAIDIIGMGLSDRQKFDVEHSTEAVIDFFVEAINQWRIQLSFEEFTLVGHSFGGFVSANYTVKYPEQIKELFLLSPMAGTKTNPQENLIEEEYFQLYADSQPFFKKMILKYVRRQHQQKLTVQDITRKWFIPTKYIIGKALNQKIHSTDQEEIKLWSSYFTNLYKLPESTDHFIHDLVTFPYLQAKISIEEQFEKNLSKITQTVHIFYGDSDWMDSTGLYRISKSINSTFRYVKDSSHQIYFDQPFTTVNYLLNPYQEQY